MPDDKPTPKTLDELEQQLTADELKPEVVSAESQADSHGPEATDDRGDVITVSDEELEQVAQEADAADGGDDTGDELAEGSELHVEERAKAKPPFFKRMKFWVMTSAVLLVVLLLAWFIRPSRIFLVNLIGLRTTVMLSTATPAETGQPSSVVRNVTIDIGNDTVSTNDEGKAESRQPYGELHVSAQKPGYDAATADILLDFDPFFHLLGGIEQDLKERTVGLQLKAVGLPLKFKVIDWLSEQPITHGSFAVGDIVAQPDGEGVVSLRLPADATKSVNVKSSLGAAYYVDKEFTLSLGSYQTVSFVPSGNHFFISKRSGGLAAYSAPLDGASPGIVMNNSASETAAMNISYTANGKYAVITSSRDGKRDAQGNLLQKLYVYNVATKKLTNLDEGLWFRFADWAGETLVYTVGERLPGKSSNTQRLAGVRVDTAKRTNLSQAANFGVVRVALGEVLYSYGYSGDEDGYETSPELRVVAASGGVEKTLAYSLTQLTQTAVDTFAYQTGSGDWHQYASNTGQVKNSAAPASLNRVFVANSSIDIQWRLAIDKVDGVTTIIARHSGDGKETKLFASSGITGPIRWAGNSIVFRMADGTQTADYALSLAGGKPKKITDVSVPVNAYVAPPNYFELN